MANNGLFLSMPHHSSRFLYREDTALSGCADVLLVILPVTPKQSILATRHSFGKMGTIHKEKHEPSTRWPSSPSIRALKATLVFFLLVTATLKTVPLPHFHESLQDLLANVSYQRIVTAEDPVGDRIGRPDLHPLAEFRRHGLKAMVSSDVPLCSTMGKQILQRGGNAADAAVTVALCIGSVNSHSSGIGGGGFIVTTKDNQTLSIDAREMAPALAHKHMYDGSPLLAQFGGLSVAVPGELAGLYRLYQLHGSGNLSWLELFEPVIELNRKGWRASVIWARAAQKLDELLLSRVPILRKSWDFIYKSDNYQVIEEGDHIKRPNYADTLEKIANNGSAQIFYDPAGPIAPVLAKLAQKLGGIITAEDFAGYEAKVTNALQFNFTANGDEYELTTTGGVSSGLALIAGLNFYTALRKKSPIDESNVILKTHRLIEAMKWTALARSHLGDVNQTYWDGIVDQYTSPQWAETLLAEGKYSDHTTFPWQHYGPLYELTEPHGTSHFSIVDEHGGAVGMTTTVNLLFGSLVYDRETGVVLNDEMDDFSMPDYSNAFNLTPSALNFIKPRMRPLSLTAPTIIRKNGELHFLIGAAGGSRIVTAVLQAIVRTIHEDLPILETISYPRLHHQLIPEVAMAENLTMFNSEYRDISACMKCDVQAATNHTFIETGALTAMNGIKRAADGGWDGVSDWWRKRGVADGY